VSRNRPTRVDAVGPCPLAGSRARTRRVVDGETAILGPDETVPHIVRVTAESYGCPRRVDVQGIGALQGPRAGTRRVKGGNGLRRQWDGYCQGDQDGCRRHKLEFPFCEIEWFHTCEATKGRKTAHFFGEISQTAGGLRESARRTRLCDRREARAVARLNRGERI